MARKPNVPKAVRRDGDDYEIGYRRPPKASRWAPGQSGNLSGRPKGRKNLHDFLGEHFEKILQVESGGRKRRATVGQLLAEKVFALAAKGNAGALRLVGNVGAASKQRPKVDEDRPFDPEAPLSDDEREIAKAAMDYMMKDFDEIAASIDHHLAERNGSGEDKP